ncbi:MAG: transketolase family protein [bacterium]|nr:transketolase family protein [bacterium]
MSEKKPTRVGYGETLVEIGQDERVYVLTGDLKESVMVHLFAENYPKRFIQVGIAEQNMCNVAAGLALIGKIPFWTTYGAFASCRALDMIRVTVCYSELNVKIIGGHSGLTVGPDGASHQILEDIAIIRSLPNIEMVIPCDYWEAKKATRAIYERKGPKYLRLGRAPQPIVTDINTPFVFGKANILTNGNDVAIIACGQMVSESLIAANNLSQLGITARVINMHTLKPIDRDVIIESAKDCKAIVTVEEHQINGGLGSAVAQVCAETIPVPIEYVAIMDKFGKSGDPDELLEYFGLRASNIEKAVQKVLQRKF